MVRDTGTHGPSGPRRGMEFAHPFAQIRRTEFYRGPPMSYDILKSLGLDHLDANSPEFMRTLERMQREAFESLQSVSGQAREGCDRASGSETIVG